MPRHTIILAHGVLGFGTVPCVPIMVDYFNGVTEHLESQGHKVIAPTVQSLGSVEMRGEQLADAILAAPLEKNEQLHVIAHSMGGLDARYSLSTIPGVSERVKTLVTIGTPHKGSPVADAIVNRAGEVWNCAPSFLKTTLRPQTPALIALTTEVCTQFDAHTPDVEGVRYIDVAGDASKADRGLIFLRLAAAIGRIHHEINDGMVTKSSALRDGHEHLDDWPVDHAGQIGWSYTSPLPVSVAGLVSRIGRNVPPTPPHLARYDQIVEML